MAVVSEAEDATSYCTSMPEQTPLTQVPLVQVTPEPHVPLALHVSTPLPEHVVARGVQEPVQPPLTHAWSEHATALPHVPLALHVSTPLPEHVVAPGVQEPVQPLP